LQQITITLTSFKAVYLR